LIICGIIIENVVNEPLRFLLEFHRHSLITEDAVIHLYSDFLK